MKAYTIAFLALLMIGTAFAEEPAADQIKAMVAEEAINLATYSYERVAEASIRYSNSSFEADFQASKVTQGMVNLTSQEGWWEAKLTATGREESLGWEGYFVNGSEYWKEGDNWTEFIVDDPASIMADYNEMPGQANLVNLSSMELVGTEICDGEECYVLSGTPPEPVLQRMLGVQLLAAFYPSPFTMPSELGDEDEEVLEISNLMNNSSVEITAWASKDSGLLKRLDINSSLVMTPEMMGISPSEFRIESTLNESTTYSQFGSSIEIELPPEALEGETYRTEGTDWRWAVFGKIKP
ncbi:MAG: hypothetical protein JW986_03165 [Methanotrichaceae archaeon]|nr:hypothetical protein [Methanotrichaceae archaeon]